MLFFHLTFNTNMFIFSVNLLPLYHEGGKVELEIYSILLKYFSFCPQTVKCSVKIQHVICEYL